MADDASSSAKFFMKCFVFIILVYMLEAMIFNSNYTPPMATVATGNVIVDAVSMLGNIIGFFFAMATFSLLSHDMPIVILALLNILQLIIWVGIIWTLWPIIVQTGRLIAHWAQVSASWLKAILPWPFG